MLGTTTPTDISEGVLKFCTELDPTQTPVMLRPEPDPKAIKSECFGNVRDRIRVMGGSMQIGWIIWETPKIMLEAMFHADWRSPEGKLVDITPPIDGEEQLLFLPDSTATIHNPRGDVVGVPRFPLVDDPVLYEFIEAAERKDAILVRTQGMLTRADLQEMAVIEAQKLSLTKQLSLKYRGVVGEPVIQPLSFRPDSRIDRKVGRNEQCPCGSGKKFKKCHGQ